MFSNEEKVSIKYLQIKYKYSATWIVNNHAEYERNANGVKKLLKKIDETGGIARKEGSKRPKTVRTEANIKLVEEMILSRENQPGTHSIAAEIASELNIDSVALWCSGYHYCTTSFNKVWTQILRRFQSCLQDVRDSRWWGSLAML